jgi:hypothetical protein
MSSNSLYIKNIVSNNCGGIGSWRFNALSSPAPGAQTGGFKKRKATRRRRGRGRKTRRRQKVH